MALKHLPIITAILTATSLVASVSAFAQVKQIGQVERVAKVIAVEHKDDHRIRIYLSATEDSGGIRYPISTIERNMVHVDFTNTSTAPAEAQSLSLLGSQPGDLKRALFLAFDLDRTLTGREISEVRERVSDIISELPAQYLTAAAISQGSARILADVTPEKSDNINRIQQQLAALPAEGEGPALSDTLCVAAERFHAWNLNDFKASDQKVLIIVSPPGDAPSTERYRAQNCWRSLAEQKVRVFQISFRKPQQKSVFDLSVAARESGGFVHHVSGPLDILAASKNVVALLKNEYVLDVDAPDISLEDQPLELKVRIAYHDAEIVSGVHNVGFVIPTLAQVFVGRTRAATTSETSTDLYDDVEQARKVQFVLVVIGSVVLLILFFFAMRLLKVRMSSTKCNTCNARVRKDHADCPFRRADCMARLVMMSGTHAGMTYPLVRGPNRISSISSNGIVLPRGGVHWFNHGTIVVDGFKVAYTPSRLGRDRLNGFLITETKLLGQGYVLKIGQHNLRLEVKPSASGSSF